ncbi:MAG TPA: 4-hydroxy-tetrahydrodipicolinate reductase [Aquaticitalea sp.]|nr:4-hydroxy-tetrahydrodipicolinate reductase [Aquaticitalea sp.]
MNIALLGYGKMGKAIESIAESRGHTIVLKINEKDSDYSFHNVDVAIDFSIPNAAVGNITKCLENNVPIISGTTGWLNKYDDMVALCKAKNGTFLYASNFSLGVNIFFELNRQLARMMKDFPQYGVSIEEIHHTQKLDAPSGTAISLANQIIEQSDYVTWQLGQTTEKDQIGITAKRIENVPGTHEITYASNVDNIQIKHTAHSREGFALGAVVAAEWIVGKKGVFTMKDVLQF